MTLSIFADILKWSEQRPPWQRDALRRLFTSGDLTATDFDELTETCKARQHDIAVHDSHRAAGDARLALALMRAVAAGRQAA